MINKKIIHGYIYGGTNNGFYIIENEQRAKLLEDEFIDFVGKNIIIIIEVKRK